LDPPADGFQKFLQALGYWSSFEFDPEKEERIQMHADKLYHRMLDYETRVKEARAAGLEPPPPRSLFNPEAETISQSPESSSGVSDTTTGIPGGEQLPPGIKPTKPLKDLTPHERELEVRRIKQKMAQSQIYMREVANTLKSEEEAKAKRRQKLSGWFGPTIAKWLA
jgi:hypothetical protein